MNSCSKLTQATLKGRKDKSHVTRPHGLAGHAIGECAIEQEFVGHCRFPEGTCDTDRHPSQHYHGEHSADSVQQPPLEQRSGWKNRHRMKIGPRPMNRAIATWLPSNN